METTRYGPSRTHRDMPGQKHSLGQSSTSHAIINHSTNYLKKYHHSLERKKERNRSSCERRSLAPRPILSTLTESSLARLAHLCMDALAAIKQSSILHDVCVNRKRIKTHKGCSRFHQRRHSFNSESPIATDIQHINNTAQADEHRRT